MTAPFVPNDILRLATLRDLKLAEMSHEPAFDDLTRLAALICDTPIAGISFVDEHRQWFTSSIGLSVVETPRENAFCTYALLTEDVFQVRDAAADPRFADNPLVASGSQVRLYAGAPLVSRNGHALGALCVMDTSPRELGPEQVEALRILARQAMAMIELREALGDAAINALERTRAEEALLESEAVTKSFFDNAPMMMGLVELDGADIRHIADNAAAASFFGTPAEDMQGRLASELGVPPAHINLWLFHYRESERLNKPFRFEYEHEAPSGVRWMSATVSSVASAAGRKRRFCYVVEDVTDRKAMEGALAEARDKALAASRAKSVFLTTMNHELRTPLNAIIGYSELLEEDMTAPEQGIYSKDLARIKAAAKSLLGTIDDILDLSRLELNKITLRPERIDVARMLEEAGEAAAPFAEKTGCKLAIRCGEGVGEIVADPVRLHQCLKNLLTNAAKFTHNGFITLSAERAREGGREILRLSVADTGIGINPAMTDQLFDEFSQADTGSTRRYGGTGLGLTITRRLCRLMRGSIGVKSELGRGSTFTITLPIAEDSSP